MWPVLKPNSQYTLAIDYRNLNKFLPKMDGVLLDAEEVINRITARNSEYFVTIDMSDMFFALPIAPQSRE